MQTIHCFISGRVQGVWFRGWTQKTALAMNITGWVRNLPDGRVECMASAEHAALEEFRARLAKGSPFSRVDTLECEKVPASRKFAGFRILG